MIANLQERKERIATIAKWGLAGAGALLVAPIIFMVVQGIIGLAIAGTLGLLIVNFAPVVAMKFANWKVAAIKAEAMENPIETLENLLIAKSEAFKLAERDVTAGIAARNTFEKQVQGFTRRYPARAAEFQQQLAAMDALMKQKIAALKQAQEAIESAQHKVVEMKAYWEMSQAAQAANKAVKMDTGDLYARMKEDTAVDAVFASMSQAFAELEVAAALQGPAEIEAVKFEKDLRVEDLMPTERVSAAASAAGRSR